MEQDAGACGFVYRAWLLVPRLKQLTLDRNQRQLTRTWKAMVSYRMAMASKGRHALIIERDSRYDSGWAESAVYITP